MKIILTSNEDIYMDMLMNDIDPSIKMEFVRAINTNPLIDATVDEDGNTVYTISEEYTLGFSNILIKHSSVVVPLCKGLFAAVQSMTNNILDFTKGLFDKYAKRRNDIQKAEREYEAAKEKLRKAKINAEGREDKRHTICNNALHTIASAMAADDIGALSHDVGAKKTDE